MDKLNSTKHRKRQKGRGYKYDTEFKMKVGRYYLENDFSSERVGEIFNISHQRVSAWAREFSSELSGEIKITPMTAQEQRDMEALKQQIELLKRSWNMSK